MDNIRNFAIIFVIFIKYTHGYTTWDEFWTAYTQEAYYPRMYAYGTDYGDDEYFGGDTGTEVQLSFHLPYAGKHFSAAYVARDGHIELSNTNPATYSYKDLRTEWPNMKYPNGTDPPFISPYIADFDVKGENDDARVYWRVLDPHMSTDENEREIMNNTLEMASHEARHHVVGAQHFHAKYGILVTWHYMTHGGCVLEPCLRNTLQAMILADDHQSHVIYNFYDLAWAGGINQLCDPLTGGSGAPPYDQCVQAQVGFNAGWAERFTALPLSKSDDVITLDNRGATGVQGRYIYRVDTPTPVRGGCSNETYLDSSIWPLEISPLSISLYGGDVVYFSGPCLLPANDIVCRFGGENVPGYRVNDGQSMGMCVAPTLWTAGWTEFCISTDGGVDYDYCTQIHIVPKYWMWPKIMLHEVSHWYALHPSGELSLGWDPEMLQYPHMRCDGMGHMCNNGTDEEVINVHVKLVGYTESVDADGSRTPIWHQLHTFAEGMENSGNYSFLPHEHECTMDCDYGHQPPIGLIEISVEGDAQASPRRIYSEPFPLGWYFDSQMTLLYGDEWSRDLCIQWATGEMSNQGWQDELEPCPMTHAQAQRDMHYMFPPPHCEPGQSCPMQPRPDPHIACADGPVPGPQSTGASSSCCYHPTPHSSIIYGLDHIMGSTAHRASPHASISQSDHHVVPLLSHMTRDRQPYMWCCNWTADRDLCIEQYMNARPVRDAVQYESPQFATAYGDPHLTTFDGTNITFNGHSEYWLLHVPLEDDHQHDSFSLQSRMEPPPPGPHDAVNATLLSVVVMQEGPEQYMLDNPAVQIAAASSDSRAHLQVFYDGHEIDLTEHGLRLQHRHYTPPGGDVRRITLMNNDPEHHMHQSDVTVMFHSGVSVQVANRDGYLHVTVLAPPLFYAMTGGLFGLWNGDPSDDLRTRTGQLVPSDESTDFIHTQFGQSWEVQLSESRFHYRGNANRDYYRNASFLPNFDEPMAPVGNITDEDVVMLCGANYPCSFDYKTTMDAGVANASAVHSMWIEHARADIQHVAACPYVDVPHSEREVDSYLLGGEMTFTRCTDGYTLQGRTDYECVEVSDTSAEWDPNPDAYCKDNDEIRSEKAMLATSIVVPLLVLIIIAAVLGTVFYKRKQKKENTSNSPQPPKNTNTQPKDKNNKDKKDKKEKKKKSTNAATTNASRELQFENMAASAERSQSLASVNVSFGPGILTQDLHTERPPRPQSVHMHPGGAHNSTAPPQLNGSRGSLTGAHGYNMSPHGYTNQSYEAGGVPGMGSRTGSQNSVSRRIPQYDNTPSPGQPTLAQMAQAFQPNQSHHSIYEQPPQINQSQQSLQYRPAQMNQSQQSLQEPAPPYSLHNNSNASYARLQQNAPQLPQHPPNTRVPVVAPHPVVVPPPTGAANLAMEDDSFDTHSEVSSRAHTRSQASLAARDTFV